MRMLARQRGRCAITAGNKCEVCVQVDERKTSGNGVVVLPVFVVIASFVGNFLVDLGQYASAVAFLVDDRAMQRRSERASESAVLETKRRRDSRPSSSSGVLSKKSRVAEITIESAFGPQTSSKALDKSARPKECILDVSSFHPSDDGCARANQQARWPSNSDYS
jgi:hypothetical protein